MRIVLSAHFDLHKQVSYIKLDSKNMTGLVDNFAGIFAAYQASRITGVDLYLTNFEEKNLGGAIALAPKLKSERPLVIVVDTCTDVVDKKAYIGNAYNFDTAPLKKEFSKDVFFKDGLYEPTEDETAIYGADNNLPTFFFGVPINGEYHDVNNKVALEVIDHAAEVLVRLVRFLQTRQN